MPCSHKKKKITVLAFHINFNAFHIGSKLSVVENLDGILCQRASSCDVDLNWIWGKFYVKYKRKCIENWGGCGKEKKMKVGKYLFGHWPLGSFCIEGTCCKHWGQLNYVTFNSDKLFIPHIIPFPPPPKLKCIHKCKARGRK